MGVVFMVEYTHARLVYLPLFSLLLPTTSTPSLFPSSHPPSRLFLFIVMAAHLPIGLHGPLSNVFGGSFIGNLLTAMYVWRNPSSRSFSFTLSLTRRPDLD